MFYFSLCSLNAFAQDCSGMRENEVVRLDKNNGPLVNARVQDQDGLGICFATSSSLALQSALPGNPDVSYLQLSFAYAQKEVVPSLKGNDSAFKENGETLISSGRLCKTIEAAQAGENSGICKREDVVLENTLFNPKDNLSKDTLFAQTKIIQSVSEYYDSIKDQFGVNQKLPQSEIAKRTLAFTKYKSAFENLINNNQSRFTRELCLKPETENAQAVIRNMIVRIYTGLINKYGEGNLSKVYAPVKGGKNPDMELYLYFISLGEVQKVGATGELRPLIDKKVMSALENGYLGDLNSSNPSPDALTALRKSMIKNESKSNIPLLEKILSDLSPADIALLEKDYNHYVKKDISECMKKNAFEYYKDPKGFIKDYENDICLKNYLPQGQNFKSLTLILDKSNLANINSLTTFMGNLPKLNYEQAMSALVAPDCSGDKKIKIPKNIKCEDKNINFTYELKNKIINDRTINLTLVELDNLIKKDEDLAKLSIESHYPEEVAKVQTKYAGKTDASSLESKKEDLANIESEKKTKLANANAVSVAKIVKQIIGPVKEQQIWNEFYNVKKKEFSTDALTIIKSQKQVVPVSICTRFFSQPNATSQRDGTCEQSTADNSYKSVGGMHSVGIIGLRCQKGKLNYLIQNSWGEWSDIKTIKNADGSQHFESEMGRAWVTDDELMNNLFDWQKITK
jgi:hypothetical protein